MMRLPFASHLKPVEPERLFWKFGQVRSPYLWIAFIWFLFVAPAILLRAAHYEEGTLIGLARGAFEDGHWLSPYRYGQRFVERPVLLSWLMGVVGLFTGTVTDWMARIPIVASLLLGACLVYYLVRQYASPGAGFFGVLCFMASPVVLDKVVTAETDVFVATVVFSAFVLFWNGERQGGAGTTRWLVVGLILGVAACVKGPQPLGFFFLGLGAFFLLRGRWADFVKLGVIGLIPAVVTAAWYYGVYRPGDERLWAWHSRLWTPGFGDWILNVFKFAGETAFEFLPGWLLLFPLAWRVLRRPASEEDDLMAVLILYASVCTVVLTFWPGAKPRYAIPAILPIAAAAGLAFDRLRSEWPQLIRATSVIVAVAVVYRVAFGWLVMPLVPERFQEARIYGQKVTSIVAMRPAPIYVEFATSAHNILVYVPYRIRELSYQFIAGAEPPFWALVRPEQESALRAARTDLDIAQRLVGELPDEWRLLEIKKK